MSLLSCLLLITTALVTLSSIAYLFIAYQMSYWRRRNIAHIPPDFFYGNLKGVMERLHFADIFRAHYTRFKGAGPFSGFYMLCNASALVLDLKLAKRILIKDFHNFSERGFFYNERDDPLTAHIFSLPLAEWRQLRAKLSPAFTAGKLRMMLPLMLNVKERLELVVTEEVNKSDENCFLELKDLCDRFTTDVIGACIFGLECNSLQDPSTEFRSMNQNLFDNPRNHRAIDGLLYAFPRLARFLRLKQIPDSTSEFYFRIITQTMAYREEHKVRRNDLLHMLLDLKAKGALSLDEIVANAFLFFFAGFETSSTTMTLALWELAKAEAYQELARKEIVENLKRFKGEMCYEYLQSLSYLDQIINETLRKYPILPHLIREAKADYPIPGHPRYVIPKGMAVLIPAVGIQYDPEFYTDPQKFDPERFSPDLTQTRDSVEWLGFGDGSRACIGRRYAQIQMRIALCQLLQHFQFSICEETEHLGNSPALGAQNGIALKVKQI